MLLCCLLACGLAAWSVRERRRRRAEDKRHRAEEAKLHKVPLEPTEPEMVEVDMEEVPPQPTRSPTPPPVLPPLSTEISWRDEFLRELRTVFTLGYTFHGVAAPAKWNTQFPDLKREMTEEERKQAAMT